MAKRKSAGYGSTLRRGGKAIEVERVEDRFTVIPSTPEQIEQLRAVPGISEVDPIGQGIYRAQTSGPARDTAMETVRAVGLEAVAHHAYRPKDSDGTVYYLTDKIVVRFKPEAAAAEIDALLDRYGLRLVKSYDSEPSTYLVQVTSTSGENPLKISNQLGEDPLVENAEPNLLNRFMPAWRPMDDLFPRQWHLEAADGPQLTALASVNAPAAWEMTRGSRDIVVAIMDDGFDLSHPDFQGQGKIVAPRDYIDGDADPFPVDGDYHGTPCAGVAVAEANGRGVVGVAPDCAFMPVRFPLNLDDDALVEIFTEVGRHAHVISCSWGPPPVDARLSEQVDRCLSRLAASGGPDGRGCVIAFAAGNFNAPLNDPVNAGGFVWRDYQGRMRRTTGPIRNGFAYHPEVLCVAASTSMNLHSAYSNWGAEVNVCAPSNNFHPLNPQAFVPGRGIWTTDNEAMGAGFTSNSRFTGAFGGTSSATPLAAGMAALVRSANPSLTAAEVRGIIEQTADKIVDNNTDIVLGTNRGQYAGGRCDWFGFGKINAVRAVQEARNRLGGG
jgi:subtilisin family serine protease